MYTLIHLNRDCDPRPSDFNNADDMMRNVFLKIRDAGSGSIC